MLLYIVRHGDPDYTNDCLTPLGKRQAEAVSRRLSRSMIDRVYTSSMGRAIETATPTCELLKKEYTVLDWAKEIPANTLFPDGKEKNLAYLSNIYTRNAKNMDLDYYHSLEADGFKESNIESGYNRVIEGAKEFLKELGYEEEDGIFKIVNPNNERIALFCHGNMARTLASYLLHIPVHIMWSSFGYPHTGVTVINFANSDTGLTAPRCLCYADLSHIYADDQALKYNNKTYI